MADINARAIASAQRTLELQNDAMTLVAKQYANDEFLRKQLLMSLDTLFESSVIQRGKIVMCGIGKSYKIAAKLVATLNSLAIQASILHPLEALHGDLGMIREGDTLVFVTASGNTPELLQLLPHLLPSVPILLLTCSKLSELAKHQQVKSLLYAELPPHLKEEVIHGLPAPTVSTTITLALADATILALSEMIEDDIYKRKVLFSMNHPGGAIGASLSHLNVNKLAQQTQQLKLVQVPLHSAGHATRSMGQRTSSFNSATLPITSGATDMKQTVSSQTSSSSLLSLGQLKERLSHMNSQSGANETSVSSQSSEDEDNTVGDYKPSPLNLKVKILNQPELTLTILDHTLISCTKQQLIEWITLYDFIVAERQNHSKVAAESTRIKAVYRAEVKAEGYNKIDDNWDIARYLDVFTTI